MTRIHIALPTDVHMVPVPNEINTVAGIGEFVRQLAGLVRISGDFGIYRTDTGEDVGRVFTWKSGDHEAVIDQAVIDQVHADFAEAGN